MALAAFPIDTVLEILENLYPNPQSLLSCALVNRQWCAATIPILWQNPFRTNTCKHKNTRDNIYMLKTYFGCFSKELQQNILKNKVVVSCKISPTIWCFSKETEKPTFRYASFLRTIKYENIHHVVRSWVNFLAMATVNYISTFQREELHQLLLRELFKL